MYNIKWMGVLSALLFCSPALQAAPELLDRTVRIINRHVILESELLQEAKRSSVIATFLNKRPVDNNNAYKNQVLKQMISYIGYQEMLGLKQDAPINNAYILQTINDNHPTLLQPETKRELAKLFGCSEKEAVAWLCDYFRPHIIRHLLLQQRIPRPGAKEIAAEVERLKSSHLEGQTYLLERIRLNLSDTPTDAEIAQNEATAAKIIAALKNGDAFETLALEYSSDPDVLKNKGEMGWKHLGGLPLAFADALKEQPQGAIIGPVRTPTSWHIFKIKDKKSEGTFEQTEYRCQLIEVEVTPLTQDAALKEQLNTLVQQLREKQLTFSAAVKKYSKNLQTLATPDGFWYHEAQLKMQDPQLLQNIKKLAPGQSSAPIRGLRAWYLVKLLEKRTVNSLEIAAQNQLFERYVFEQAQALDRLAHATIVEQAA